MPTLIVGAGGIGLLLAHLLADEHEAHLLSRGQTLHRLQTEGFVVFDGGQILPRKVPALGWQEWRDDGRRWRVILAVKAGDLDPVLAELAPHAGSIDCLVLAQNGLGILEVAAAVLPGTPMIRIACYTGVQREAPTIIRIHGRGAFRVAASGKGREHLGWIRAALEPVGFPVQVVGSPHRMEWEKAMLNLVLNGICTLVAAKNGVLIDSAELHALADQVLDECLAVSRARGVTVKKTMKEDVFAAAEKVRDNANSTLQDLLARRGTELPYLHGKVIEWAAAADVPCPATTTLYRLLHFLEGEATGRAGPSPWPRSIWPHRSPA